MMHERNCETIYLKLFIYNHIFREKKIHNILKMYKYFKFKFILLNFFF